MKENTLELSFEMYEELKETLIKTLRTELVETRSQSTAAIDTDAIKRLQIRILQLEQAQTRVSEAQQERGLRIEQWLQAISERQEQISEDLGAQISGIDEKVIEKLSRKFGRALPKWFELIDRSFLPEDMRRSFKNLILRRMILLR